MLREFIFTAYTIALHGDFAMLREYFELIAKILAAPVALPRIGFKATIQPKE